MPNKRKVQLTKKFAAFLDGIDLSRVEAGDDIELSEREANLLIAEGWALPTKRAVTAERQSSRSSGSTKRARPKR